MGREYPRCILDLVLGETFEVLTNSVDVKMMIIIRRERDVIVDEEASCLGVVAQVEDMKTLVGGFEFHNASIREDAKHPITVVTIIGDYIFLER